MKASPEMQARLLDLADLDTTVSQLAHKLRSMPELTDIARLEGELPALQEAVVRTETELSDLQREVAKAEAAVQLVRDRAARDQQRLDAGTGSAKDLQSLQSELESLARRQGVLEDEELEVMERVETAEAADRQAREALADLEGRLTELRAAKDEKSAAIETEKADVQGGRDAVAADLSAELLKLYERMREHLGSGAAPLQQRRCGGCRLEINAVDLGKIRAAAEDDVVRCEECGRILVRTAESGL